MLDARKISLVSNPYAPTAGRQAPTPQDLAQHRPMLPYHDTRDFADRLDAVDRAAAMLSTKNFAGERPLYTDSRAPSAHTSRPRAASPNPAYHDSLDFADRLDAMHRPTAVLIRDRVRDVAVALQALTYEQKRQVATALRTTVTRLNTWASLMLEARP
jgi:hypothetical protein